MNFHQFLMQSLGGDSGRSEDIDLDTQFCPTLLIGLGGTGANVLLRVKKLLQDRLQGVDGLHRFLYVDTDTGTFAGQPGLPPIEGSEKCLIGVRKAQAAVKNPDYHDWLWKRFPQDELKPQYIRRLVSGNGASQIRSLGAAGIALDYSDIREKIASAHSSLIALSSLWDVQVKGGVKAVSTNVMVYIIGSLAGGTGSGCFLDVAMIAQDVCRRDEANIVGMFSIANRAYDQKVRLDKSQRGRMRANTYAALKELQYVMDAGHSRKEPIVYSYGTAGTLELAADDRLFDLAYLIDDRNQLGTLPTVEEMYDLMARTVYQDVGSVLGAARRSFGSNSLVAEVDLCKVTNLPRMFGSVATTSLIYPAERVATYTTLRALEELVRDELLGTASKLPTIKSSVSGFLAEVELEERGNNNRLLEQLLYDKAMSEVISVSSKGIDRTWGQDFRGKEFSGKMQATKMEFTNVVLPEVRQIVNRNFDQILGTEKSGVGDVFAAKIAAYAHDVAAKRGVSTVVATLADLEETVEQMTRELEAELRAWTDKDRPAAESIFNEACDKLRGMSTFKQAISKKDEELKAIIVSKYNNLVENDLWAIAKPKAIQVLKIFKSRVAETRVSWTSLQNDLVELARDLSTTWRGLEAHAGVTARGFVVVQEVTSPGYEQRYYKSLDRKSKQNLTDVLQAFGRRQGMATKEAPIESLLEWMADMGAVGRAERIGQELAECLFASIAPPLLGTNIVTFIRNNPKEVGDTLAKKLDLMYAMCQPFWPATSPRADQEFSEFMGLTVKKHWEEAANEMVPPSIIKKWADKHGSGKGGDEKDTIHTNVPYEIVLSRRTYGARAFYLDPVMDWKGIYDEIQNSSKNAYMTETHAAFLHAPNLVPENSEPLMLFALGLAFGFIVTRGDWYYFGLDVEETSTGLETIRVLFDSQSETVFSLTGSPFPDGLEGLSRAAKRPKTIRTMWKLAQGRENAAAMLTRKREWMAILHESVDRYQRAVGNSKFRKQIESYRNAVLADKRSRDGDDVYSREHKALTEKLRSIGR